MDAAHTVPPPRAARLLAEHQPQPLVLELPALPRSQLQHAAFAVVLVVLPFAERRRGIFGGAGYKGRGASQY